MLKLSMPVHIACAAIQVVGALITHTGSGMPAEVDNALATLLELTKTAKLAKRMTPFMPFIQGVLDFVLSLTDDQVRYSSKAGCSPNVADAAARLLADAMLLGRSAMCTTS